MLRFIIALTIISTQLDAQLCNVLKEDFTQYRCTNCDIVGISGGDWISFADNSASCRLFDWDGLYLNIGSNYYQGDNIVEPAVIQVIEENNPNVIEYSFDFYDECGMTAIYFLNSYTDADNVEIIYQIDIEYWAVEMVGVCFTTGNDFNKITIELDYNTQMISLLCDDGRVVSYDFDIPADKLYGVAFGSNQCNFIRDICVTNREPLASYTSYFTGNSQDVSTQSHGGVCLMGGSTEDDNAMKWFLQQANGGDILVLRASGADGYNDYLFSELSETVNSVETIVFNSDDASSETYIHEKISKAEGIWFAGGDQWDYVRLWRDTPIADLINDAINDRNVVIGGISAGMAIMGSYYFSAENGTIQSEDALANPLDERITVEDQQFIQSEYLNNVITDTHFDNPDRSGRLTTFLARIVNDYSSDAFAIACDEFTAVCIDSNGEAHIYGNHPDDDDNAYFLQVNCEVNDNRPELLEVDQPLQWDSENKSIKAYVIKGTPDGQNTFDLNNWQEGNGGEWQNWYVTDGQLSREDTDGIQCQVTSSLDINQDDLDMLETFPNPVADDLMIQTTQSSPLQSIEIYNTSSQLVQRIDCKGKESYMLDVTEYAKGVYHIQVKTSQGAFVNKIIVY